MSNLRRCDVCSGTGLVSDWDSVTSYWPVVFHGSRPCVCCNKGIVKVATVPATDAEVEAFWQEFAKGSTVVLRNDDKSILIAG